MNLMKLSEYIIKYRTDNNLSQRQFAEKCGLSNSYISMIENELNPKSGKPAVPTLSALKKMAQCMGISIDEFIGAIEEIDIKLDKDNKNSANSEKTEKILKLLNMLTPAEMDNAINYIGYILSQRGSSQDNQ